MITAPVLYPIYPRKEEEKRGDVEGARRSCFLDVGTHPLRIIAVIDFNRIATGPCQGMLGRQDTKKLHSRQCTMEREQLRRGCAVFA